MAINTDNLETVINTKITAATSATENKDLLILSKSIEALNTSPVNLSNLGDSDLTALLDGHVLRYVASTGKWTSGAPTGSPTETLTSLALNGSSLTYTDEAGTLNAISLSPSLKTDYITDIVVTSPVNGEVLTYNSGNSQWENTALTGAPSSETFTRTVSAGASSELTLTNNHNNSSATTVKEILSGGSGGATVTTQWDFEENAAWDYDAATTQLYGSRVSLLGTPHDVKDFYETRHPYSTVYTTNDGELYGVGQFNAMAYAIAPWSGYSAGNGGTFNAGRLMDYGLPSGYQVKDYVHAHQFMHVLLESGHLYSCGDVYRGRLGFASTTSTTASVRYPTATKVWNNNTINTLVPKNENEYETVEWFQTNDYETLVLMSDGSVWYTGEGSTLNPTGSSYTTQWTKNQYFTDEIQARMTTANNNELPKLADNKQGAGFTCNSKIAWMYWEDGTSIAFSRNTNQYNIESITSITWNDSGYARRYICPQLTGFTGDIKMASNRSTYHTSYWASLVLTTTGELWGIGWTWLQGILPAEGEINTAGSSYGIRTDTWTLLRNDVKFIHGAGSNNYGERLVTLNNGTLWSVCGYNYYGRQGRQSLNGSLNSTNTTYATIQSYKGIVNEPWTTVVRAWADGGLERIWVEDADGAFWLMGRHEPYYHALTSSNSPNASSWKASVFDTAGVLVTSTSSMDLTGFSSIVKITAEGSFPTGTTTKYAISLDGKVTWVIPNGSSTTIVADASAGCDLAALETFDFVSNPSNTLHVQLWLQTSDVTLSPQIDRVSLWTTVGGRVVQSYLNFEVEEVGANIVKITNTGSTEKTYQLKVNHT